VITNPLTLRKPQSRSSSAERRSKATSEPSKKELKEQFQAQQERKLAERKNRGSIGQEDWRKKPKLENTIGNIDSFTIAQSDDKDDMASDSRFARCETGYFR